MTPITDHIQFHGTSMFPFVPPRSTLALQAVSRESIAIRVGDIVCYPEGVRSMTAHRVVRIVREQGSTKYFTQGDAQPTAVPVPEEAIAYVVRRVSHRLFAYDVDGVVGRIASDLALRRGPVFHGVRSIARGVASLRQRWSN